MVRYAFISSFTKSVVDYMNAVGYDCEFRIHDAICWGSGYRFSAVVRFNDAEKYIDEVLLGDSSSGYIRIDSIGNFMGIKVVSAIPFEEMLLMKGSLMDRFVDLKYYDCLRYSCSFNDVNQKYVESIPDKAIKRAREEWKKNDKNN